jgi:hypothetical protein
LEDRAVVLDGSLQVVDAESPIVWNFLFSREFVRF